MYNNKKKLGGAVLAAVTLSIFAQQVSAELYVSPVVRKTVKFDQHQVNKNKPGLQMQSAKGKSLSFTGQSSVHGEFIMKEQPEVLSTVMRFGQNVPLFVAIERVVPESSDWYIHLDEGLDNSIVNWEGGNSWESVLNTIGEQNNLVISVNHEERAIGVSKDAKLSQHLAMRIPQIWRLKTSLSLRENLEEWSQRAGWQLEWDDKLNIDYPINHGAVLTGRFVGEDGVVDQILYSLRDLEKPLRAKFHKMNNVLLITEAGYQQEVMY